MSDWTRNLSFEACNRLINQIYDAGLDPDVWPVFLESLTQQLNAKSANLIFKHEIDPLLGFGISYAIDSSWNDAYIQHFVKHDVWDPALKKLPAGKMCVANSIFPVNQLIKTEFFNDFLKPQNIRHAIGGHLIRSNKFVSQIGVQSEASRGGFDDQDVSLLQTIAPHINKALEINQKLNGLNTDKSVLSSAIDNFHLGIIILDKTKKINYVNITADAFFSTSNALSIKNKKLFTALKTCIEPLNLLINTAIGEQKNERRGGGALSIYDRDGHIAASVSIIPISNDALPWGLEIKQPGAIIFLGNLPDSGVLSENLLANLYQLTKAESIFLKSLGEGYSLDEISNRLCVTKNTLRSHLSSIFRKTGTNRQSELIKFVFDGPAMLNQSTRRS